MEKGIGGSMVYRVVDLSITDAPSSKFAEVMESRLEAAAHELKAELGSGKRPKLVTLYRVYGTVFAVFDIEFRRGG
jgi:hypothetical protein